MMPVEEPLPASPHRLRPGIRFTRSSTTFPSPPLAIKRRDTISFLAYAVGFGGGSMIWFRLSSAGVALSNMYPRGQVSGRWLRHG